MTWIHVPSPKLASSLATEALRLVSDSPAWTPKPSATSRTIPTASDSSFREWPTDSWMMRHYGMMSEPLTDDPGVDTWILLLRDSRANPTASPDSVAERLTNAISGQTPLESSGKLNRAIACLKTSQVWFTGITPTQQRSLQTFPTSGMTQYGILYRLRPLVPRTSVGGGGVWPTPSVQRFHSNKGGSDASDPRGWSREGPERLTLDGMAKTGLWPTPTATDAETSGADIQRFQSLDVQIREHRTSTQVGGQLNPVFVEWLQGLPQGWTSLAPLPPESYQRWQQGDHWGDGEWPGVPRVATGVKNRVNRLRTLGNGIVPAVVAEFLRHR